MSDDLVQPAPMPGVSYDPPASTDESLTGLGVSHRDFAANLSDPERLKAWKTFTDDFWRAEADDVPPTRASFLFRRGFFRDKWALYSLHQNDIEAYLSDFQLRLLYRTNTIYAEVLENRLIQTQVLENAFRTPVVYALRDPEDGELALSDAWEGVTQSGSDRALTVRVEPLNTSVMGKSAEFRVSGGEFEGGGKNGPLTRLDGVIRDWAHAARSPYVIRQAVHGGRFSRDLSPSADVTLHVLMFREETSWAPRMFGAVLRIGTSRSGSSNAVETGGLSAWLDPGTGAVQRVLGLGADGRVQLVDTHPDTGAGLAGVVVPGWPSFRDRLFRFFDQSSYLRLGGFDFVVQEDDVVFVGASNMPDLAALQIHAPLLGNPALAEYLRRQKI